MLPYRIGGYNENSLLITIDDWPLQVEANIAIHRLSVWLKEQESEKISQTIPAYNSLLILVHKADFLSEINLLVTTFFRIYQTFRHQTEVNPKAIPICYHPELGNDLEAIAHYASLSMDDIINIHSYKTYHIYMIGFLPGFPYMGNVDASIAIPRKREPVPTRSGAVGIAGVQTGIYPSNSPGGWHIVGYTPLCLFDSQLSPPALFFAGQQVKFEPIDLPEYYLLKNHYQVNTQNVY